MSTFQAAQASVKAVEELFDRTGVRVPFTSFGMKESDAELVASNLATFLQANNPRRISQKQCEELYLHILADQSRVSVSPDILT